ncbi:acyl carrier protein (plasmid) [Nitratireductor rhodophyticola]|uniref:Acyl carrier protein n=1 Tax=Nitratireductor rhodophyticola TaxID=2854036 RepID=A0ABS7REV2_9HYPH|nr:acyl carrier protein [Nitratireductor rhodophyticola]MAS14621.1 acyl carrier protein [Nitratireductor sp.]MBY8918937.1 acyl carrier protein [Nitratireductor rhodophyticola]MEC9244028.1 acyl carrier protein [Pseudomonadota bacterium]MBY8923008.1 acyl carrier protein [Nitratireductor rhodophyticola]WPZ16376.1 acyl carrier protein [Nitratireductor rhodophyticola]
MSDVVQTRIRDFIVENFLFGDDSQPLPGDLSLIESDMVDSTGILELVGFLEEGFGLTIADADIVPANLDSIDRIAAFIERKKAA